MSTNQANATRTVNQQGLIKQQANAVSKRKEPETLQEFVLSMQKQFAKALPSVITPERFTRIALTALSTTPKLAQCDAKSFMGGLMQAAQLGLEPNTPLGQAYLIPYGNQCQFQIGYKGLIDLAYRSGEMSAIYAHAVYENDEFGYEYGLEQKLVHKPAMANRGKATSYYAVWKLKNGGYGFGVMSVEDVEKHARTYSKAYNSSSSPWKTNFDEMAKKTVLKAVLKYAPIKTDFIIDATQKDEAVITADDGLELHANFEVMNEQTSQDKSQNLAPGELTEEQVAQLELDNVPFGD